MVSIAENIIELSYMSQLHCVVHVAQLKCWVGTAGGSLGVFTVTRRSVGEPLQLEKTGNFVCMYWYLEYFSFQNIFNQEKASRRIQLLQLLMQSSGADTSISGLSNAEACELALLVRTS